MIDLVVERLYRRLTLLRHGVARHSEPHRLPDQDDVDAAGVLLVDLEDLPDVAVLP